MFVEFYTNYGLFSFLIMSFFSVCYITIVVRFQFGFVLIIHLSLFGKIE